MIDVCSVGLSDLLQARFATNTMLMKNVLIPYELPPMKHTRHLLQIVLGQSAGKAEVAPDGLPDPLAIKRPAQRIDYAVGDGAVIFMSYIYRGHKLVVVTQKK